MAVLDDQQIQDPSVNGATGLKGLEGINRLKEKGINIDTSILTLPDDYRGTMEAINQATTPKQDIGFVGINDSRYDKYITSASQLDNLANTRGELQPWYAQIGAGLAKGAILAGTTFLDGTIGLVLGAGQGVYNLVDGDPNTGFRSGLWDNDFSRAMQSVNKWSEEALPNYYTDAEREQPWTKNILTSNFLGDKFIKNLGFTVGAFYSGGVASAGIKGALRAAPKLTQKASNLAKTMRIVKDASQFPSIATSAVGATISAVNEGRIEALNNSTDWFDLHKAKLDDQFGVIDNNTSNLTLGQLNTYNEVLSKINEDRIKMGNADMLMNLPILTASNIIQFGKLYANGFKTARKATNIVEKSGKYTAGTTKLGTAVAITGGALSEGSEEILQSAASRISGDFYFTDVNNFYKAKVNPEAAQETLSWVKSFAKGINETVNDGSAWEEFFIGSLTGALGMPRFRGIKNESGSLQSPITIEGGSINKWREYREKIARERNIADYINNRVNSPEFRNYYQGLIRHNKYQNDMNQAAEQGDEFDFKNAEHAQLVSDIAMFDNAGRTEDLKTLISSAYDISDENLIAIVENTTAITDKGDLVGPFAQYAIKNADGTISVNFGNEESKQEMIEKLTQNKDDMLNTIKQYQTIRDELDIITGQQLSDDQLEELTWMKSQIDNWSDRAVEMSKDIRSSIDNVIGNLSAILRFNQAIRSYEGQAHANLSKEYLQSDKNIRAIEETISALNIVMNQDDKSLAYILANRPKLVDGLIKEINEVDDITLNADEKQNIITKFNDIVRLGNASKVYNAKLKEYLGNPKKQIENHIEADKQSIQQEVEKKSKDLKNLLNSATNLQEFRGIIDSQDDTGNVNGILESLENEGNEMAKNYRETSQYNNEVRLAINSSDADVQTKQDAIKLLQDQFNNSKDLEQLANPNSVYINNENAFDEDSEGDVELSATRFQEAQYALQNAMFQVNNDNRFKDRFSPEYKKPAEKREGTVRGDDRTTTGDSGTSTIPTVTSSRNFPATELPVGNITAEMVNEENKKANERVETPQRPNRDTSNQFYRPAIPELHIEASKEGDFRPFDIVVSEREKNADFSGIYGYLRDQGAFRYVNEGNLKAGDELGFMIDPDFNDHTIFIIDKRNGQVVGSLDESDHSVSRYEGLKGLEERIRGEYANRQNKTGKFVATPITKVSKVMVGRIPYGNTERSLSEIPNVSSTDRKPVFGIIKNGVLTTNGKIDDSLIIKPVDMSQKEGRLYLLIPNGAGKYSPAAVRVKHFNNEEFNLNDSLVSSTPVGEDIKNAITKLSTATSQGDVSVAMQDLAQDLYMQDIMVTWFSSRAGDGIVISKRVRKPDGTYEEVIINGKEQIKEDKYDVYFSVGNKYTNIEGADFDITALEDLGDTSSLRAPKDPKDIYREILGILTRFNLPLQVSARRINDDKYNDRLVDSDILTSNIIDASVRGTWFTTDYFDDESNLHQAISPASVAPQPKRKIETPVGGTEGAIAGTRIVSVFSNKPYYVDLKTNTIRDDQGRTVEVTDSNRILLDLVWAQDNFGSSANSSMMVDNKVLTPDGKVLDRSKQIYLSGQEAQDVKDTIAGRKKEKEDRVAKSKEVISEIYENQKKIDKTRTDGEFYYVLEDDGEYHPYSRVHSRLGSNWVESSKQTEALTQVRTKLSQLVDTPAQFDNYLKFLENKYKISLDGYQGKTDAKSRDTIVNIVRDEMSGTNSQRALDAGSAIDSIIRQYFTVRDVSKIVKPSNISENAFIDLITTLNVVKSNMEQMGERFLADNIVLFQKYPDGTRIAGEVDVLSVDKNGNFRIYDVKTSRYSFYDFTDKYGNKVNYFTTPSTTQRMSAKDYYTLQLSAYKNLFESQYGVPVTKLAVMPFVLNYDKENISSVQSEKGIPIAYNPAVNVPLASAVKVDKFTETPATPAQAWTVLPIFETSLEIQNPIEDLIPEADMENSIVGYYEIGSRLHKGYITPVGIIGGVQVYMTKIPTLTTGTLNKEIAKTVTPYVAYNDYYAIFPNGKTFKLIGKVPIKGENAMNDNQAKDTINRVLGGNPSRVQDLSKEKTILFNPDEVPTVSVTHSTTIEIPATINQNNTQVGAAYTVQKEEIINVKKPSRMRHKLRRIDESINAPIWNQKKELNWLNRVLPQLSEDNRVRVVKGLIKVSDSGPLAWGQFDNGIITLSDIAAKGTVYHEAFHTVFNLLLDNNERQALYNEAKKLYGEKDDLSLEEDMAEGFREYVMTQEKRGLGRKILDFFRDLFAKVTNWGEFRPYLISYYRMINQGKYSNSTFKVPIINELRGATNNTTTFNSLNETVKENLLKKGWTAEKFDSISQEERDQAIKCIAF